MDIKISISYEFEGKEYGVSLIIDNDKITEVETLLHMVKLDIERATGISTAEEKGLIISSKLSRKINKNLWYNGYKNYTKKKEL